MVIIAKPHRYLSAAAAPVESFTGLETNFGSGLGISLVGLVLKSRSYLLPSIRAHDIEFTLGHMQNGPWITSVGCFS